MNSQRPSFLRTKLLIYPKFQLSVIVTNALAWLAFVSLTLGYVVSSSVEMSQLGHDAGFEADHVYFRMLDLQRHALVSNILVGAGLALILSSVFFLWISHRVVGPLFNLQRHLANYVAARARGEKIPPLKFRRHDFFREIAAGVNAALSDE